MFKYRVKKGRSVNQNGELKREGDIIDLEKHVAFELRTDVEPVDEAGKFPEELLKPIPQGDPASMRLHEQKHILEIQKENLEKQLALVTQRLSQVSQDVDAEIARKAAAHQAKREASPRPAVPASVGSPSAKPAVAESAAATPGSTTNAPASAPTVDVVAPDRPTADK